jgi:DNA-binding NtrC family response regulator
MLPPPGNSRGALPGQVTRATLPPLRAVDGGGGARSEAGTEAIKPLWQVEKDAIEAAITAFDGNIPRAAAALGISASTIYRKKAAWEAGETDAVGA